MRGPSRDARATAPRTRAGSTARPRQSLSRPLTQRISQPSSQRMDGDAVSMRPGRAVGFGREGKGEHAASGRALGRAAAHGPRPSTHKPWAVRRVWHGAVSCKPWPTTCSHRRHWRASGAVVARAGACAPQPLRARPQRARRRSTSFLCFCPRRPTVRTPGRWRAPPDWRRSRSRWPGLGLGRTLGRARAGIAGGPRAAAAPIARPGARESQNGRVFLWPWLPSPPNEKRTGSQKSGFRP